MISYKHSAARKDTASSSMDYTSLGTIELELAYVQLKGISKYYPLPNSLKLPGMDVVHEKSKKCGAHVVT